MLHIELLPHAHARLQDPFLGAFLEHVRRLPPYLLLLESFFAERILPPASEMPDLIRALLQVEKDEPTVITVLTVSNAASALINARRVASLLPQASHLPRLPADPRAGSGSIALCKHVRLRVTRNLDKDRGLVNGTLGVVAVSVALPCLCLALPCSALVQPNSSVLL